MTTEEFRANDDMVSDMAKIFQDPTFRTALACVRDSGPGSHPTPAGIDPTAALIRLGRLEQHEATLKLLLSLSKYPIDLNVDNDEMVLDEKE